MLRGREFTFLKLQSCAFANDNDREVQHFESPREDFSEGKSEEDDEFSRDENENHGVDGLMNHFSLNKSLKNDSNVELKLPLHKCKPSNISCEDENGLPILHERVNQIPGLKTTTTAELKLKQDRKSVV
jgi:hypothetical protein